MVDKILCELQKVVDEWRENKEAGYIQGVRDCQSEYLLLRDFSERISGCKIMIKQWKVVIVNDVE